MNEYLIFFQTIICSTFETCSAIVFCVNCWLIKDLIYTLFVVVRSEYDVRSDTPDVDYLP